MNLLPSLDVPPEPETGLKWPRCLGWAGLLIVAGYALFSHGCHWGDEDTELRLRTAAPVAGLTTDG